MSALLKEIYQRRELLQILVSRNLKIRYKNSALGFFWTLLGPLFLIVIYSVFLGVLKFHIEMPVLVTGIIVWQFLAMCLGDSLNSIIGNANLVTKSSFPRIILPLAMVKANFVNFMLSFVVVIVYLLIVGADFGALYFLPLIMLTQLALCIGISMLISCTNVFFRDVEHILSMVMLAWFFMTPVIYEMSLVLGFNKDGVQNFPDWVHYAYFCNPMTGIVTMYRMVMLSAPNPGPVFLAISISISWIVFFVGISIFQKLQSRFGDEL